MSEREYAVTIRCGASDVPVVGALLFAGGLFWADEFQQSEFTEIGEGLADEIFRTAVDDLDDADAPDSDIGCYLVAFKLLEELDPARGDDPPSRFDVEVDGGDAEGP